MMILDAIMGETGFCLEQLAPAELDAIRGMITDQYLESPRGVTARPGHARRAIAASHVTTPCRSPSITLNRGPSRPGCSIPNTSPISRGWASSAASAGSSGRARSLATTN